MIELDTDKTVTLDKIVITNRDRLETIVKTSQSNIVANAVQLGYALSELRGITKSGWIKYVNDTFGFSQQYASMMMKVYSNALEGGYIIMKGDEVEVIKPTTIKELKTAPKKSLEEWYKIAGDTHDKNISKLYSVLDFAIRFKEQLEGDTAIDDIIDYLLVPNYDESNMYEVPYYDEITEVIEKTDKVLDNLRDSLEDIVEIEWDEFYYLIDVDKLSNKLNHKHSKPLKAQIKKELEWLKEL